MTEPKPRVLEWRDVDGRQTLTYARIQSDGAFAQALRALATAFDEGVEAASEWIANNPDPSGIWTDPPSNPYEATTEVRP